MATASFEYCEFYGGKLTITIFYDTLSLAVTRVTATNNTGQTATMTLTSATGKTTTVSLAPGNTSRNVPGGAASLTADADGNLSFTSPVTVSAG